MESTLVAARRQTAMLLVNGARECGGEGKESQWANEKLTSRTTRIIRTYIRFSTTPILFFLLRSISNPLTPSSLPTRRSSGPLYNVDSAQSDRPSDRPWYWYRVFQACLPDLSGLPLPSFPSGMMDCVKRGRETETERESVAAETERERERESGKMRNDDGGRATRRSTCMKNSPDDRTFCSSVKDFKHGPR